MNKVSRIYFLNATHLLLVGAQRVGGKTYGAAIVSIEDRAVRLLHPQPAVRINPAEPYGRLVLLGIEPHALRAAYVKTAYGKPPVVYIKDPRNVTVAVTRLEGLMLSESYPRIRGRWSPDGSMIAIVFIDDVSRRTVLVVLDRDGRKLWTRSFPGPSIKGLSGWQPVAWSPGSKTLIYQDLQNLSSTGASIVEINAETGSTMCKVSLGRAPLHSLVTSGKKLLAVEGDETIVVSLEHCRRIGRVELRPRGVDTVTMINSTTIVLRGGKGVLVVEKIPEIGVLSIKYSSGPPLVICVKPEQTKASFKTPICDRKERTPWLLEAVLPPGRYTIEVPARSLVDAIARIGGEVPGIGKAELTDLLKAYLEATNKIPLATVTVKDLDFVAYNTSLEKILEKNLATVEVKGPPSTKIRIVDLVTRRESAARIPVTGTALLILPPGTYRIEYQAPSQDTYRELAKTRLEPGDHKTLKIPTPTGQTGTQAREAQKENKNTQQATKPGTTKNTVPETTAQATQHSIRTRTTRQPSSTNQTYIIIGLVVLAVLAMLATTRRK